jgi:hypothetical protein
LRKAHAEERADGVHEHGCRRFFDADNIPRRQSQIALPCAFGLGQANLHYGGLVAVGNLSNDVNLVGHVERYAASHGDHVEHAQILVVRQFVLAGFIDEPDHVDRLGIAAFDHHHVAILQRFAAVAALGGFG